MKRISTVASLILLLAMPVWAAPSVEFSTAEGSPFSWQLANVGGVWQLSFAADSTVVDDSEPADAVLLGDSVNLPTMTLSNIATPGPGILTATLTPLGDLAIQADAASGPVAAGETVLTASVGSGTFLTMGTNYIAYSFVANDLHILSSAGGYGVVIPELAANQAAGGRLDLAFSGDSRTDLFSLLMGANPPSTVKGNMSGVINAIPIPAPGALLLVALGTSLIGWLRQRKFV
jgi:hypothetical protein